MKERQTTLTPPLDERITIAPTASCQGCTEVLISRHAIDLLGQNTMVIVPPSCGAWAGLVRCATRMSLFPSSAAMAAGVAAGYGALGYKDVNVLVIAGDGGTHDIGLQALSGAAERGDSFIWVCQNNEAYMNTGMQRSGATPQWARTTTTPVGKVIKGKQTQGKDIISIMEAHHLPYIARASMAHLKDFKRKMLKARQVSTIEKRGISYIEVLNTCPTGWDYPEELMITMARLAVETGVWPLIEIEDGDFRLNLQPKQLKPVKEYIKLQGRFKHFSEEQIEAVQDQVAKNWAKVLKRANSGSD
ncbi:MAG: pyruvate synthase subunit beta [Candidatus Tectomicrobia bacterium]|uniref:Pyruvate synthase subunit beta n=1 Tax=Tectimicrobiota bacterium TaxID=2528274 RepID=A0A933GNG3_UNCTE|nr:pyruvate synthase subunit beta [Candidatus Tectomicrobia bacterium]